MEVSYNQYCQIIYTEAKRLWFNQENFDKLKAKEVKLLELSEQTSISPDSAIWQAYRTRLVQDIANSVLIQNAESLSFSTFQQISQLKIGDLFNFVQLRIPAGSVPSLEVPKRDSGQASPPGQKAEMKE